MFKFNVGIKLILLFLFYCIIINYGFELNNIIKIITDQIHLNTILNEKNQSSTNKINHYSVISTNSHFYPFFSNNYLSMTSSFLY
jgi:hypothetical protein